MASIIAAGTTSGTSISVSGDTSGQLVLQTNGTTTAVTISTGQVVTLAQPLPVASGGSGVTTSTGTGAVVLGTSPTMATPTFDSAQLATVVGTAPLYMARAWVNFNGTGTVAIRGSGNVSSITDNGTGDYTVNFTTAMSDGNWSASGIAQLAINSSGRENMFVSLRRENNLPTTNGRISTQASDTTTVTDAALVAVMFVR